MLYSLSSFCYTTTMSKADTVKVLTGTPPTNGFDKNPQNINKKQMDDAWTWKSVYIARAKAKKEEEDRRLKVADAMFDQAEKGNVQAAKEIADRTEGKAPQAIDQTITGNLTVITNVPNMNEE